MLASDAPALLGKDWHLAFHFRAAFGGPQRRHRRRPGGGFSPFGHHCKPARVQHATAPHATRAAAGLKRKREAARTRGPPGPQERDAAQRSVVVSLYSMEGQLLMENVVQGCYCLVCNLRCRSFTVGGGSCGWVGGWAAVQGCGVSVGKWVGVWAAGQGCGVSVCGWGGFSAGVNACVLPTLAAGAAPAPGGLPRLL